jgi:hypothetical protein
LSRAQQNLDLVTLSKNLEREKSRFARFWGEVMPWVTEKSPPPAKTKKRRRIISGALHVKRINMN